MIKCIWCGREYPDVEDMDVEIDGDSKTEIEIGPVCKKCIKAFDYCPDCKIEMTLWQKILAFFGLNKPYYKYYTEILCDDCKETRKLQQEYYPEYQKIYERKKAKKIAI